MGRFAVLPALLLVQLQGAFAAGNLNDAVREAARKASQFAGPRDAVTVAFRNLTSLSPSEAAQAQREFESLLRDSGNPISEVPAAADLRVTISENPSEYLLITEARRGGERQVWISGWPRRSESTAARVNAELEKKLLIELDEPILDAVVAADSLLVLNPGRLVIYAPRDGRWEIRKSVAIAPQRPWPRDPRGHLRISGQSVRAFLPGVACTGSWQPELTVECRPGDEVWVLESGTQSMLLAGYTAGRNFFDGRITTQTGARKTVAPFYTAAAVEDGGTALWILTGLDGRAAIFDPAFAPAGTVSGWGSDIAGVNTRCGTGWQVLATRPDDTSEAVQAFSIVNRQAEPLTPPLPIPGPVTALWSAGASAVAVAYDSQTGKYAAYQLTISCGS